MRDNIFASLPDAESATKAIGALLDHGVQPVDMSILMKSLPSIEGEAHDVREQAQKGITVTTVGDAATGAIKGAGIGLGLGAVAAVASVALPGVGIVLGGGALAAAIAGLAGAAAAGAVAGGVTGFLVDQGVEPHHVQSLTAAIDTGGALVGVSCPSGDADGFHIRSILEKYGGTVHPLPMRAASSTIPETATIS
ncbi:MAG: hypothetical protein ABL962_17810 [Fimbriimonadaceae bacterium]